MSVQRCGWCSSDPLYMDYHDQEWGKPEYKEARLFEMLCLEGQQAGFHGSPYLKNVKAIDSIFFNTQSQTSPNLQINNLNINSVIQV